MAISGMNLQKEAKVTTSQKLVQVAKLMASKKMANSRLPNWSAAVSD